MAILAHLRNGGGTNFGSFNKVLLFDILVDEQFPELLITDSHNQFSFQNNK